MSELVTTIIPVRNRSDLLIEAVESVMAQTYRPIEIIIVDDASTDTTAYAIQSLVDRNPDIVHCVRLHRNSGPGAAREAGRRMAQGTYLQYLDSDDVLLTGKLESQVSALQQDSAAGIAYGKTRYVENNTIVHSPWKQTGVEVRELFPSFLNGRWWGTSTALYRTKAADQVGAWSDLRQLEDWEYDCRFAAIGTKLVYVNCYVSEERAHAGVRLSSAWKREPEMMRDRARAHVSVYQSAQQYGIDVNAPDMKRFARTLFLTARQCGGAGLHKESRELFELARKASGPQQAGNLEYRTYALLASILGWGNMGRLSTQLERFRA